MMSVKRRTLCLYLAIIPCVLTVETNEPKSSVHFYEKGVEAYLENNFEECVKYFEKSLEIYRVYSKRLTNCRLGCKNEADLTKPLYSANIDDLMFYEKAVRTTLCIMKCKNDDLGVFGNSDVTPDVEKLFEDRRPYEYLHICYFKTNKAQHAASAAFTYLVTHPDDKVMQKNLKFYSEDERVNMKEILNVEAPDYVYLYVYGADAYEKKDWDVVIQNMEESLENYLQTDEECRAQCEGPFSPGWYPDFIPEISNHFAYSLKCKQKCSKKLSSLNGEFHEDLFPSHYHYLQYAYFKKGNLLAACQAVASYLLFYPDDETMKDNFEYFSKLPKVEESYFTPRQEALRYFQRQTYEKKIINFIKTEFKFNNIRQMDYVENREKIHIIMTEKELDGPNRFVLDGLIAKRECQSLLELARNFAITGDGYEGRKSPHTSLENFKGLTLSRAIFLVYVGLLNRTYLEYLLKVTEDAKKEVEKYFGIRETLYFSYTHLVCRSALAAQKRNKIEFSHSIHADNCNILKNGSCPKEYPAYTWRDYSAIVYLNNDFDGGEFVFSADAVGSKLQSSVEPQCGRMVAFSSGMENLHGVKAVENGSRCAVAIWFTHDVNHEETNRDYGYYVLENNLRFHPHLYVDVQ